MWKFDCSVFGGIRGRYSWTNVVCEGASSEGFDASILVGGVGINVKLGRGRGGYVGGVVFSGML